VNDGMAGCWWSEFPFSVLKSWVRQPRRAFNRSFGMVQAYGDLSVMADDLGDGAV